MADTEEPDASAMTGTGHDQIEATLAVCTHNGAKRLPPVIECFARIDRNPPVCEFLVIDNGSTDNTAEVVREASERIGIQIRIVREEQLGKAYAIRRAAMEAEGQVLCLLDDDNLPNPGFVHWALKFFQETPTAGVIGGRIRPKWHGDPTPLVQQISGFALAMCDRGDDPFKYGGIAAGPVGAGMCVRRDMLRRIYTEIPEVLAIGRVGNRLSAGDDTAINVCARRLGFECWYVPDVSIRHIVHADRMELPYLMKLFDGIGVGQADVRILYDDRVYSRTIALLVGIKDCLRWLNGAILGPLIMETSVGRQRRRLDQRLVLARARRMLQHGISGWPEVGSMA